MATPPAARNALQRRYFRWAEARYACMSPELAAEARRIDAWLYSRSGLVFGVGWLCALAACLAALRAAGLPLWPAVAASVMLCVGVPFVALSAWLQPQQYATRRLLRLGLLMAALSYGGAFLGFLVGRLAEHGSLGTDTLVESLRSAAQRSLPALLITLGAVLLLMWGVAQLRSAQDRRALLRARLEQERDSAARQAAEARLQLLQAQIQPHFLFNTLAALQHWVDSGDPRAGPLLRSLTIFLRGSTELLGHPDVPLQAEIDAVRAYLAILHARLGSRLAVEIEVEPAAAARRVPPGLLLTLVENAVEHGITPALHGGTVRVAATVAADGTLRLAVQDDGAGLAAGWREGTGLRNTRDRVRVHTQGRGQLTVHGTDQRTEACIDLPPETDA